jgi:hypothetical protein
MPSTAASPPYALLSLRSRTCAPLLTAD